MDPQLLDLSKKQLALLVHKLQKLHQEPIAVIGMACRFPGKNNTPEQFWENLAGGRSAIDDIPEERWNIEKYYSHDAQKPGTMYSKKGGFLKEPTPDLFDASFFRLSHNEAANIDPQQRLLLEVAWESLENANIVPDSLAGTKTGVFLGIGSNDYIFNINNYGQVNEYTALGNEYSVSSGRLSYFLGLEGPSMAIDTACSSSLVSVHIACNSLSNRECDLALVGGSQLILSPQFNISLSKAGVLSPTDKCSVFDAKADGYVRGEGCGLVVLKRLRNAIKDGDNVLAIIRGTAVNHVGKSSTLTAPRGKAQEAVINKALYNANVKAGDVGYIEAHGTGTRLGDPIEMQALGEVYNSGHSPEKRFFVGSVKPLIGHLEAASGIASLIKVVLLLQNKKIPPNINFDTINSNIDRENNYFDIPTKLCPWPERYNKHIAGISSFGFSGTNSHIIVEAVQGRSIADKRITESPHILTFSAKSSRSLLEICIKMEDYFHQLDENQFANLAYTLNTRRTHFNYRLIIIARNIKEACESLLQYTNKKISSHIQYGTKKHYTQTKVLFNYSEIGKYKKLSNSLYQNDDIIKYAINECAVILNDISEYSLQNLLFKQTGWTKAEKLIASFSLNCALTRALTKRGIRPYVISGDKSELLFIAHAAGMLTLRDALHLILEEGRRVKGEISDSFFKEYANAIRYSKPKIPIFFNGSEIKNGNNLIDSIITGEKSNICKINTSAKCDVFLNVSAIDVKTHNYEQPGADYLRLSVCFNGGIEEILHVLGRLYVVGVEIDWESFYENDTFDILHLPTYAFQRKKYWHEHSFYGKSSQLHGHIREHALRSSTKYYKQQISRLEPGKLQLFNRLIDKLCLAYLKQFFSNLDFHYDNDTLFSINDFLRQNKFLDSYSHVVERLLDSLESFGFIKKTPSGYRQLKILTEEKPSKIIEIIKSQSPDADNILNLIQNCGENLANVLNGKIEPQQLLFPESNFSALESIYKGNAVADFFNGVIKEVFISFFQKLPNATCLRIMEVGGGTGCTTETILPLIKNDQAEYFFSDISPLFLDRAKTKFSGCSFITYGIFNLEKTIVEQNQSESTYDIIIASNVVHATNTIQNSIDRIRRLLAPGGLFVMTEITQASMFFNLSFNLATNPTMDREVREKGGIFLSPSSWEKALRKSGFKNITIFPPALNESSELGQHIFIAQKEYKKSTAIPAFQYQADVGRNKQPFDHSKNQSQFPENQGRNDALVQQLVSASKDKQKEILIPYVAKCVAEAIDSTNVVQTNIDQQLIEMGIDSLMMVALKQNIEKTLNINLPNEVLYNNSSISTIVEEIIKHNYINNKQDLSSDKLIALKLEHNNKDQHIPFPLFSLQNAYIIPLEENNSKFIYSGGFYEIECVDLNFERLSKALDILIQRHEMLRSVIMSNQRQVIIKDVPHYTIDLHDLSSNSDSEIKKILENARDRSGYAIAEYGQWPLLDIKAYNIKSRTHILFIYLPAYIFDAIGAEIFFDEWGLLYNDPNQILPKLKVCFRDYVHAMDSLKEHKLFIEANTYWWNIIPKLSPMLSFKPIKKISSLADYHYSSYYQLLDSNVWKKLKIKAAHYNITIVSMLFTAFTDLLSQWTGKERFSINAMGYNRFIPHPDVHKTVWNISSNILISVNTSNDTFRDRASLIQKQLLEGFNHRHVSGVEVLQQLQTNNKHFNPHHPDGALLLPVMFDSLLGVHGDMSKYDWLGTVKEQRIERPPEVLDCQIYETEESILIKWDAVDEFFEKNTIEAYLAKYVKILAQLA